MSSPESSRPRSPSARSSSLRPPAQPLKRLTLPVLRLLEGYWPRWLRAFERRRVEHHGRRVDAHEQRLGQLEDRRRAGSATPEELQELLRLDAWLRRWPTEAEAEHPVRRRATRLGNVLRAAETWPADKYGLDAVKWWPRLWLLLPDDAREEITQARGQLDASALLWLWSVLFMSWTWWAWWAAPAGALVAVAAYAATVQAAATFGDLVESAFDVYRVRLYDALRWPIPLNPVDEREQGEALTAYMWRGSELEAPAFRVPASLRPERE